MGLRGGRRSSRREPQPRVLGGRGQPAALSPASPTLPTSGLPVGGRRPGGDRVCRQHPYGPKSTPKETSYTIRRQNENETQVMQEGFGHPLAGPLGRWWLTLGPREGAMQLDVCGPSSGLSVSVVNVTLTKTVFIGFGLMTHLK